MTVAELIASLQKHDPNLVVLSADFFQISGAWEEEIEDKCLAEEFNMKIGEKYIKLA